MDGGNPQRLMVLGQSGAGAIVVAALYFVGALLAVYSWVRTGFSGYNSILLSCIRALAPARKLFWSRSHWAVMIEPECRLAGVLAFLSQW